MARGYPDFEGNKSGLYLKPEWAAFEATDWNVAGGALGFAPNVLTVIVFDTVPLGRRIYITQFSFGVAVGTIGNVFGYLAINGAIRLPFGGAQGCIATVAKPIVATSLQLIELWALHTVAGNQNVYGHMAGYLI